MPENEPVVIELTDGKMRDLPFTFGGKRVGISVKAETHTSERVALAIWELPFNRRIGEAWFKPDPARVAVLKDRERIGKRIVPILSSWGYQLEDHALQELLAAIDEPDEPDKTVSDFEQGVEAMRKRAIGRVDRLSCAASDDPDKVGSAQRLEAYRGVKQVIQTMRVTEPPR